MNRTGILLASVLLPLSLAAAPPAPKKTAKAAVSHKSKVPIEVETVFGEGTATVTLRFQQAVDQASFGFRGLDGLQVGEVPAIARTRFARGEALVVEVPVTPGEGESHLVVDIQGRFRGQKRAAARTFGTGKPSEAQQKAAAGTILTLEGGQRIKVMPVKPE